MSEIVSQPSSPPHGYSDDARSRILRRRPPERALRWVEQQLGSSVASVRWFRGGSSSAVHAIWLRDGTRAVLRRYVRPAVIDEEPDIVEREVAALAALASTPLPTPQALAADPHGDAADVPALLTTRLAGRVDWSPNDLDRWLRRLAEPPAVLAEQPLPTRGTTPSFEPYPPPTWDPPAHMSDPSLWDRAVELFHDQPLDDDRSLLHRDYHPGNVLHRRGHVSGVVDWQAFCIGPRSVDAAWCRINLIGRFGNDVADRFTSCWEAASGKAYNPWAEAVLLVDVLGWHHRHQRRIDRYEHALGQRLADLGR